MYVPLDSLQQILKPPVIYCQYAKYLLSQPYLKKHSQLSYDLDKLVGVRVFVDPGPFPLSTQVGHSRILAGWSRGNLSAVPVVECS